MSAHPAVVVASVIPLPARRRRTTLHRRRHSPQVRRVLEEITEANDAAEYLAVLEHRLRRGPAHRVRKVA